MRAQVAGATGYTGREVVRQLCERGIETFAHVRPGSSAASKWGDAFAGWGAKVEAVEWEPAAIAELVARTRPDLVFGLIGTTRKRARGEGLGEGDIYDKIDYGLTAMLIDTVVASALRPRFVYLSAVGVNPTSRNKYIAARARAEAKLAASGLPHTIARPSFITGPDRDEGRPAERAAAAVGDGLLSLVGALGGKRTRDRYRSIDNVGLAAALVAAALDPASDGATLEGDELQRLARAKPAAP
jgi:uncharacterized protein YbjT (DUF2867 family)